MDTGVDVLGFKVAPLRLPEAVARVLDLIARGRGQIVTANAEILYAAATEPRLEEVVHKAELVIADGMGVVWAARFTRQKLPERVSGYDLLHALCHQSSERKLKVYMLGGALGVAEAAAERLSELYPKLKVAGTHHGYFADEESDSLVSALNEARPDFLFVALGMRGERWIYDRKAVLPCPAMQVGGSFDILAGKAVRAPRWMQRSGLEWAYRVCREPRRLKRVLVLPLFMWKVLVRGVMA